jgi:hypothetical protein
MICKPWTATSMLIAAPAAPLLLAVTVKSRRARAWGEEAAGHGAAAAKGFRVHPPGAPDDPRGALSALSLDAAKITVSAAALGTRLR